MRLLTRATAITAHFSPARWNALAVNVRREDLGGGGFIHDCSDAACISDFAAAAGRLMAYQIFPPHRLRAQVCTADGQVAIGAVIVQRLLFRGWALETAVRVIELETSADSLRFAYATLAGHPERGIAAFAVIRDRQGVRFQAEAWSCPGHWLTVLGRPVSRWIQRRITREAMGYFSSHGHACHGAGATGTAADQD
jgi:uncharacterized protein (UPF0548 family)